MHTAMVHVDPRRVAPETQLRGFVSNISREIAGEHYVTIETRRHGTVRASIASSERHLVRELRRAHVNVSCHDIRVLRGRDELAFGTICELSAA